MTFTLGGSHAIIVVFAASTVVGFVAWRVLRLIMGTLRHWRACRRGDLAGVIANALGPYGTNSIFPTLEKMLRQVANEQHTDAVRTRDLIDSVSYRVDRLLEFEKAKRRPK